jgi:hypothetical protein
MSSNDCLALYKKIIKYRKKNKLNKLFDGETENHHIIPKGMIKDKIWKNFKTNIITLYTYEHFICHFLLYKAFPNNVIAQRAVYCLSNQRKHLSSYLNNIDLWKESQEYKNIKKIVYQSNIKKAKNKKSYYNPILDVEKRFYIDEPIPEGFVKGGRSRKTKGRIAYNKNKITINNGLNNRYINKGDSIPNGWVIGGLQTHTPHVKGRKWYHNPETGEQIYIMEYENIPEGFIKGMKFIPRKV